MTDMTATLTGDRSTLVEALAALKDGIAGLEGYPNREALLRLEDAEALISDLLD